MFASGRTSRSRVCVIALCRGDVVERGDREGILLSLDWGTGVGPLQARLQVSTLASLGTSSLLTRIRFFPAAPPTMGCSLPVANE